jgi:Asp/Glu/hydantoin racemase
MDNRATMPARIWHQSMTDLERLAGYKAMLGDHARRVCGSELSVDLHGLLPESYPAGVAPVALTQYRWAHHLLNIQIVENAIRAEAEGYAAVAISCFVDPALDLARSAVDIPVVSSCETALLVASVIGGSFGLITIDASMVRILRELVSRYGYADRVRGVVTLDPAVDEFELDQAFTGNGPLIDRFIVEARKLIAQDADVIIPSEGVLNTVLVRNGIRDIDGIPVLDSYGSLLRFADMLIKLRQLSGLTVSRHGRYAKAPKEIMHHLRLLTSDVCRKAAT